MLYRNEILRFVGAGTRSLLGRRQLLSMTVAFAAMTGAAAPVAAQGVNGVTDLTVWFAREYTVPSPERLAEFEAETGITVSVDVQPNDNLFSQLIRMNDVGLQLPDIVHLDGFLRPVVAMAGIVVPIDDLIGQWEADDPEGFADIYEATWSDGMWDGELVGMANTASMEEVFYRVDWLEEAGITGSPQTWDAILEMARALKETRPNNVPFGWWAQRGNGANLLFSTMTAMGVEFDGSIPDLHGEGGQYWINFIQTMSREGLVSRDATAWDDDNMRGGFIASNIGVMLDSAPTSLDAMGAGLQPGENFNIVPLPVSRSGDSVDGTLVAPARTFFVTNSADDRGAKEAAGLFLRFLMRPDVAHELMLEGTDPHRTDGVLGNAEMLSEWLEIWDDDNVEAFQNMGTFPVDTAFNLSTDLIERLNEYLVSTPDVDPMTVADEWQPRFDEIRP